MRYDELRLRRDGDRRSDTIAKRELLDDLDPNAVQRLHLRDPAARV